MGGWKDGWMSGTDTRSVKQIINTISADNDYTKVAGPSHSSSRPPLAFTAPGCVYVLERISYPSKHESMRMVEENGGGEWEPHGKGKRGFCLI